MAGNGAVTITAISARRLSRPRDWKNPAERIKPLDEGDGHRPWEDNEIAMFREKWKPDTVQRIAFELGLSTAQRGGDLIEMARSHYRAIERSEGVPGRRAARRRAPRSS